MELAIFTGLQASGKTTFYRRCLAATHEHISKDRMRAVRHKGQRQTQLIEAALRAGRSVAVDNTNPTVEDRAELLRLGRAHGAEIVGYYFESSVAESRKRNSQRTGRERVPDVAIYATAKRLVPPSPLEGFDRLYIVRMTSDGAFECRAWAGVRLISDCRTMPNTPCTAEEERTMAMTYKFGLLTLYYRDVEAAKSFYADTLGIPVVPELTGTGFVFLKPAWGTPIALVNDANFPGGAPSQQGGFQLGLEVEDLDAALAEWQAKGIEIVSGISDMGAGRTFLARGPEGQLISVYQLYDHVRDFRRGLGM